MITHTKDSVAKLIHQQFPADIADQVAVSNIKKGIEHLLEYCVVAFTHGDAVRFLNYGALYPRIANSGRPVRNPKTGETFAMPPIATVVLKRSVSRNETVIPVTETYAEMDRFFGVKAGKAFVQLFTQQLIATGMGEHRIEFRGFGVWASKSFDSRPGRNPKTGESVTRPATIEPRFKVSRSLTKHLTSVRLG